jgi:hypothetical protein
MKKAKRPRQFPGWEPLEHRVVLSMAGMTPPPLVSPGGSFAPSVSVQHLQAAQQAFQAFDQAYSVDISTVLFAKDANGQVNLSANRAVFDADVAASLDVLDASLESIVADLHDGATLASNIKAALVGPGSQSVQNQLQAATPTTTSTTTPPSTTAKLAQIKSSAIIDAVAEQITLDIVESAPTSTPVVATPTDADSADATDDSAVSDTLATPVSETLATPVSRTLATPFSHRRGS